MAQRFCGMVEMRILLSSFAFAILNVLIRNVRAMKRRDGDSAGLKVLIVSTDNRQMQRDIKKEDYVGMSAVLLHNYSFRHGYDFI